MQGRCQRRSYALNVVPITKPKKETGVLPFQEAVNFLRCYAVPTVSNRPETLEVHDTLCRIFSSVFGMAPCNLLL